MRSCPDCTESLVDAAVSCRCGWRDKSRPVDAGRPLQEDFLRQQRDEDARAEAHAFMARHGLKNAEDVRKFIVQQARKASIEAAHSSIFEQRCRTMKQVTIDYYAREAGCGDKDARKLLQRFEDAGVIDEQRRIVPLELRAARMEKLQAERLAVLAELEQRRLASEGDGDGFTERAAQA